MNLGVNHLDLGRKLKITGGDLNFAFAAFDI